MSLGRGNGEVERTARQSKSRERELRRTGCGQIWRKDRRQRGQAADAAFKADRAVTFVRSGRGVSPGKVAVADGGQAAVKRLSRSLARCLGRPKACDQAGERDGISGDQRDNALPQWPPGEVIGHNRSPATHHKQPSGKEIPSPAANRR